jgi:hypothetical protein
MNIYTTLKNKNLLRIIGVIVVIAIFFVVYFIRDTRDKGEDSRPDANLGQYVDKEITGGETTEGQPTEEGSAPVVSRKGCALDLSMKPDLATAANGDLITYSVDIKNIGDKMCSSAALSIYYSSNEAFNGSSLKPSSSDYYWSFGNLSSGARKSFKVTTLARQESSTSIRTDACASAASAADSCTESSVIISGKSSPLSVKSTLPSKAPTPPKQSLLGRIFKPNPARTGKEEHGIWVWVSPIQMSSDYMKFLVNDAKANNITALYVTIDDYLSVDALPEGTEKESRKAAYSKALENLITLASAQGIAVDAEGGARDWAEDANRYKGFALIDYAMEYNLGHENHPLRGFQYDVESYLLPSYERNKAPVLTRFVSFIDESVTRLGNSNLLFSVVIPHFYDSKQNWTPSIEYAGQSMHTFDHLLRILERRPGSHLLLMSYRNFAQGNDGTIQISEVEVSQASEAGGSTKVIIGQETGKVDPDYVTFHGHPKKYYLEQWNIVRNHFVSYSGFGGMAVHYIDSFRELR